jgi:hypothetical protein
MGGMRRGQVTLVVAHTSHGKSAFLDQALGHAGTQAGLRAHLYFNEGAEDERVQRLAARLARVPLTRIQLRHLDQDERGRIASAMNRIPFGITDCSGWTADEIVRDMVHKRYDVVGVDTLGRIPGARRRENLEEISRVFNEAVTPTGRTATWLWRTTRTATGPGPTWCSPSPPCPTSATRAGWRTTSTTSCSSTATRTRTRASRWRPA